MNWHTETRKISELKNWESNPRTISEESYKELKKSIGDLGNFEPLVINTDGTVLAGNQRLRVHKEQGDSEVEVSVPERELTEEEIKKIGIISNRHSGEWDMDKLANEFEDVLTELGFDDLMPEVELDVKEDDYEEPEDLPIRVKLGEVWQLGKHRLMCGDSTKIEDVEKLMNGEKADMVFTDPPYNVDYGASKNPRHKIRGIKNDSMGTEAWMNFCNDFMVNIQQFNTGDIYMWGAPGPEGMRMRLLLIELGCHWSATIVWKKDQLVLTPANYQRMYEPCFYGWFDKSSYNGDRKQTEVWEIDRPKNSKLHPTMKPVELCSRGIQNSSKKNDKVLDLFGGSGSTLIACEQTNRKCYMMELDEHYCDVIIDRWETFTGNKATKLE